MALLEILKFPDERLRKPTESVDPATVSREKLAALVKDMIDTMYAARGAGLAAIQVGAHLKMFLIDATIAGLDESQPPLVFMNPEIIARQESQEGDEGCLSFPGIFIPVKRSLKVTARALDLEMREFTVQAQGLYARAIQHEIDHLEGKLLIDLAGPVKRRMIRRYMERREWEKQEVEPELVRGNRPSL